jgi:flavin reductase (DIM6/NTAB) family NADH-FMN oxidoreductase RutF
MKLEAACLDARERYRLLTGIVVPRPIAWVTTLSAAGVVNLAPFSCFMFLSSDPPLLGFTVGPRRGEKKDTARNIGDVAEFVVHVADDSMIDWVHRSADEYPAEVSEPDLLGLALTASDRVRVPRLAVAPVAMECTLERVVRFGCTGSEFVEGEVHVFHVRDGLCVDGRIDSGDLRPLGRLAGPAYAKLGDVVRMRPNIAMGPFEVV